MNIIFCVLKYFFFFSTICVLLNVQTIYTVFSLILAFIFASFLFILGGATFVGFIIVVVYVGAVLVFFLFVVMMLDLKSELRFNFTLFYYIIFTLCNLLVVEMLLIYFSSETAIYDFAFINTLAPQANVLVIGYILYTWYAIPFILCSLVLLVAMIGAISLLSDNVGFENQQKEFVTQGFEAPKIQDIGEQVRVQEFMTFKLVGNIKTNYFENLKFN